MRGKIFTRMVVIAAAGTALLAGAATTAIAEPGGTDHSADRVRVVNQPVRTVELDARLSQEQLAQLSQAAQSPNRHAAASVTTTSGDVGIMAQGGFDRDHWWFKISTAEVISVGVGVACRAAFPGIGWFVCPPISAAVNWALQQYPNAGGFWAELYTDGRVRVGIW